MIIYEKVDFANTEQIENVSLQTRLAFDSGLDPQEIPLVLRFIAEKGDIWLQYKVEKGRKVTTGAIEFIPLTEALKFNSHGIDEKSPFKTAIKNQERVFWCARKFACDNEIIHHHGIVMSHRGRGYGTLLLNYALRKTPFSVVVGFIDAAISTSFNELELAPNEPSYTAHLKAGFILAGVIEPPVYEQKLTYYCFIRPKKPFKFIEESEKILNLAEGNGEEVLREVKKLTSEGCFGVKYLKESHEMSFLKKYKGGKD